MNSIVSNPIKELNKMKRKHLFVIIAIIGLFLPVHKAFLAGSRFEKSLTAPVSPMTGRKAEKNMARLLNGSGVEYSTWMKKGKTYIKRKEYEQAILAFRKAISLRPAEEDSRFLVAWCYEKRGLEGLPGDHTDWETLAEKEYRSAIALADHLPSRYNLAILLRRNKRFEEARKQLEHILLIGNKSIVTRKAEAELTALFHQDMRPKHISVDVMEHRHDDK